jgi:GAF domain/ANTAR domain
VKREVLQDLLDGLADDRQTGEGSGVRLVNACVDVLDVTGAGIMLMAQDEHRGTLGASNSVIRTIEELQFTLGEGPCVDTCRTGRPVLEPNLARPGTTRWPEFSIRAVEAGVKAIFGFPLLVGALVIGALDVYSDHPGALRPEQVADAVTLAEVVTLAVLELQADAEPDSLAAELGLGIAFRTAVHQAAGMLSVQLDVTIDEALSRLRAQAYLTSTPLVEIAEAVVDGRLRLEP